MKIRPIVERVSLYGAALLWLAADAIDRLFEKKAERGEGFNDVVKPALRRQAKRKREAARVDANVIGRGGHA